MSDGHVIGLDEASEGSRTVVRTVVGGVGLVSRLAAVGVVSGTPVQVLLNRGRGPVLVLVRGTRLALGRGEARRILVEDRRGTHRGDTWRT